MLFARTSCEVILYLRLRSNANPLQPRKDADWVVQARLLQGVLPKKLYDSETATVPIHRHELKDDFTNQIILVRAANKMTGQLAGTGDITVTDEEIERWKGKQPGDEAEENRIIRSKIIKDKTVELYTKMCGHHSPR